MACDRASCCSRSVDLRINLASGAIERCIARRVRSGSRSLICDRPIDLVLDRRKALRCCLIAFVSIAR
eukprot:3925855-Lingulodinium_polyedra.AAC.1